MVLRQHMASVHPGMLAKAVQTSGVKEIKSVSNRGASAANQGGSGEAAEGADACSGASQNAAKRDERTRVQPRGRGNAARAVGKYYEPGGAELESISSVAAEAAAVVAAAVRPICHAGAATALAS